MPNAEITILDCDHSVRMRAVLLRNTETFVNAGKQQVMKTKVRLLLDSHNANKWMKREYVVVDTYVWSHDIFTGFLNTSLHTEHVTASNSSALATEAIFVCKTQTAHKY